MVVFFCSCWAVECGYALLCAVRPKTDDSMSPAQESRLRSDFRKKQFIIVQMVVFQTWPICNPTWALVARQVSAFNLFLVIWEKASMAMLFLVTSFLEFCSFLFILTVMNAIIFHLYHLEQWNRLFSALSAVSKHWRENFSFKGKFFGTSHLNLREDYSRNSSSMSLFNPDNRFLACQNGFTSELLC